MRYRYSMGFFFLSLDNITITYSCTGAAERFKIRWGSSLSSLHIPSFTVVIQVRLSLILPNIDEAQAGLPSVPHFGVQYPISGYSTPLERFVPQKNLYLRGTEFVPHLNHFAVVLSASEINNFRQRNDESSCFCLFDPLF
jgi:hypothetical protein